jgi:hypothetical protein
VCLIELGGTVGDIESMVFLEALRQFQFKVGPENFMLMFVSLVPVLSGEQKTKPTQVRASEAGGGRGGVEAGVPFVLLGGGGSGRRGGNCGRVLLRHAAAAAAGGGEETAGAFSSATRRHFLLRSATAPNLALRGGTFSCAPRRHLRCA